MLQAKGRLPSDLKETINKVVYMKSCLPQQLLLPGEVQKCFVLNPLNLLRMDQVNCRDSKEKRQS